MKGFHIRRKILFCAFASVFILVCREIHWNLGGGADYRLGEEKWVQVGYRIMGIKYETAGEQAGFDMQVMGPMAAIRLDF